MSTSDRHGFTLVELSVALVIVALLTGGILTGKGLLRSSQLQAIMKDNKKFEGAMMQFREQYKGWPGDITTAEDNWGSDCASTTLVPRKATCNGNGSGYIDTNPESFRTWQQLADAGLIDGLYAGIAGTGGVQHSIGGVNAPKGALSESVYFVTYFGTIAAGNTSWFQGDFGTVITFGLQTTTGAGNGGLTGREAYNIDQKVDDGRPGSGTFFTSENSGTNCVSTTTAATAEYNTRSDVRACPVAYDAGL